MESSGCLYETCELLRCILDIQIPRWNGIFPFLGTRCGSPIKKRNRQMEILFARGFSFNWKAKVIETCEKEGQFVELSHSTETKLNFFIAPILCRLPYPSENISNSQVVFALNEYTSMIMVRLEGLKCLINSKLLDLSRCQLVSSYGEFFLFVPRIQR